jgi:hypothetical protein
VFDLRSLVSVPFLVIGGVATRLYAPERMTDDLDVLVATATASAFAEGLVRGGAEKKGVLAIGGSHWLLPDGTVLDVLEENAAWVEEAMRQPSAGPEGLPVIALPYLVLVRYPHINVGGLSLTHWPTHRARVESGTLGYLTI